VAIELGLVRCLNEGKGFWLCISKDKWIATCESIELFLFSFECLLQVGTCVRKVVGPMNGTWEFRMTSIFGAPHLGSLSNSMALLLVPLSLCLNHTITFN